MEGDPDVPEPTDEGGIQMESSSDSCAAQL